MLETDFNYWTPSREDGACIASKLIKGPDDGRLVICLPGLGIDATMFRYLEERLKEDSSVLSISPPGHGYSKPLPSGNYSVDYMVDMFHEYLSSERKSNGNGKMTFAGFSIGGLYSIRYAARHPEDVSSLVLVSVGYTNPYKTKPRATFKKVQRYINWNGSSDTNRDRTIDFSELIGKSEREIKGMIAKAADKNVMIKMLEQNWDYDALNEGDLQIIAKAGIHVLFVYGAEDCFMSKGIIAEAREPFENGQCRVVAVPEKFHSFPISHPEALNRAVEPNLEFLGLNGVKSH